MTELKDILRAIHEIRLTTLETEEKLIDIEERYRLLNYHNLPVPENEIESVKSLRSVWMNLLKFANYKEHTLSRIKNKFAKITLEDITKFDQLEYHEELNELEIKRKELTSAEQLFNLPLTQYPQLINIQKELNGLDQLFNIYLKQKQSREEWSQILWRDLNISILQSGIESYLKDLRNLPKSIRTLPIGRVVFEQIRTFRDSLPLFLDLKNEALRERHWNELMRKTGQTFDMNPETFTLANIFSMELHRFTDQISEIVAFAIKELSIEKV
ncbi:unnamed protein product [Schistosoma margrebowiei]|uniref:Dynein heavy chain linker domain-containing protein n=1 Tax=Schistosoma margrebowiei TaxID=48269 RepID=A0A3P8DP72_9TREM|nr:unnamed protein product [Schistosoma margrebowiei]